MPSTSNEDQIMPFDGGRGHFSVCLVGYSGPGRRSKTLPSRLERRTWLLSRLEWRLSQLWLWVLPTVLSAGLLLSGSLLPLRLLQRGPGVLFWVWIPLTSQIRV